MLQIQSLQKSFKKRLVLDIDNLVVNENQIVGLLGVNGAGKSTLLRTIVGALPIDSGDIFVFSKSIKTDSYEIKQRIGYVPDNLKAFEILTGFEFIKLIGKFYGVNPTTAIQDKIEFYLEEFRFDMELAKTTAIGEYSTGMKKKIGLVSAFIHQPDLMLLDEPTNGLDPHGVHALKGMLKTYHENGGTVILSSHIMDLIATICEQIIIIDQGKIIQHNDLSELIGNENENSIAALEKYFVEITK